MNRAYPEASLPCIQKISLSSSQKAVIIILKASELWSYGWKLSECGRLLSFLLEWRSKKKKKKKKSKGRQRCVIGRGGSPWYCEGQRGSRPCADDSFRDFDEYVSDRAETESRDLGTGGRSQLLIKGSEGPLSAKRSKVKVKVIYIGHFHTDDAAQSV